MVPKVVKPLKFYCIMKIANKKKSESFNYHAVVHLHVFLSFSAIVTSPFASLAKEAHRKLGSAPERICSVRSKNLRCEEPLKGCKRGNGGFHFNMYPITLSCER